MNKKKLIPLLFFAALLFNACSSDTPRNEELDAGLIYKKVILPDYVITTESLGESISVCEAKLLNESGKSLTIEGFIGGRRKPISNDMAIFIMGDHSLVTCDEMPTDHCSTPWDACCEPREKIISSTLTVRLVDQDKQILEGTLNGLQGIKPGRTIKVLGKVDEQSIPESMIINAEKLEVL